MKLTIAVVLCALLLGAEASVVHWPGAVVIDPAHYPAAIEVHPGPTVALHAALVHPEVVPAPVVVAAPAPEGTYVAKTRGAVHVAPLPGHSQSATSVNLDPAPGTV